MNTVQESTLTAGLHCSVCGKPPFWSFPREGDPCPDDDGVLIHNDKAPRRALVGAARKRDVSPFPHRRDLTEALESRLTLLFKLIDAFAALVNRNRRLVLVAPVLEGLNEVDGHPDADSLVATFTERGLLRAVRASHLEPPCSRNGDKHIFLLSAAGVK